jgi:flagellar hook protein FlgE
MSLTSAMQAGVAGLVANSAALSTISNNIANVDTVGYKQSETDFESLVNDGAVNTGDGSVMAANQQLVSQGGTSIQTSSPLDLMIAGSGFFVTTPTATQISANTPALFTQAGSFTVNSSGYLVNSAGLVLQGWLADSSGNISTNASSLSSLQPINVSEVGGAVEPTTSVSISSNINADATISTAYNAATNSMAMYEANSATGVAPDYSITIPVSDTQGGQHTVQLELLKSSTPNQWDAELVAVPASDVQDGTGLSDGQIATGTLTFTATGQIDVANSTLLNGANSTFTIGASTTTPAAGQVSWSTALGVGAQTFSLNLAGGSTGGGLTQLASTSATTPQVQANGTAFGSLSSVQVDSAGVVTAVYSNGVTRPLAQIAVATFPDPDALTAVNGEAYQVSPGSGTFTLQAAGQGTAGEIDPSTLESSTVDLSSQLTDLITSQSAYSASSKIITTANQMMQDLLNIIQ